MEENVEKGGQIQTGKQNKGRKVLGDVGTRVGGLQRMEEERSVAGGRKRTVDEGNRERGGGEWKM